MRKILVLILAFVLLLLCGCGKGGEITPKLMGISFKAEMTYYNENYSFTGEISDSGQLTCEMTAPEGLSGMVFTVNEEKTVTEYKGITYSPVEGSMPFAAVIESFYGCINEIIKDPEAVADHNGILENDSCTLTVSPGGFPQKLTVQQDGFYINFYNITLLSKE